MFEIRDLTHAEKVFFAGCLRGMILADGYAKDEEIAGLDELRDVSHFDDLDVCLEEFESAVQDDQMFWAMAAAIVRPDARELIFREPRRNFANGRIQKHQ